MSFYNVLRGRFRGLERGPEDSSKPITANASFCRLLKTIVSALALLPKAVHHFSEQEIVEALGTSAGDEINKNNEYGMANVLIERKKAKKAKKNNKLEYYVEWKKCWVEELQLKPEAKNDWNQLKRQGGVEKRHGVTMHKACLPPRAEGGTSLDPEERESNYYKRILVSRSKSLLGRIFQMCQEAKVWDPKHAKGCYEYYEDDGERMQLDEGTKSVDQLIQMALNSLSANSSRTLTSILEKYDEIKVVYRPPNGTSPSQPIHLRQLINAMVGHRLRETATSAEETAEKFLGNNFEIMEWEEPMKKMIRRAPHMLHTSNATFLIVRLFYSLEYITKCLQERNINWYENELKGREQTLLATLGDENDKEDLAALVESFEVLRCFRAR
ncbi:uncharacterized protein BDZ99DRAFT_479888 [Mytilinidion resinicola]|uniref:Uncharacterized protein n=1 Tax=Mytilinidion resinicola TaxID=574789 RepID=A0A6A6YB66_9PEZI|nr:uncharacterized protein BDZ99DRAFT_479888 [Mytilinidion resinicola]KAF2805859.1 hypothetical protein BDZ99DRAFT_479888 [Mytilinidion resinicola]